MAVVELKGSLKSKVGGKKPWPYSKEDPTIIDAVERAKGKDDGRA